MDARNSAGIAVFGDALLSTGDLDPVYTAIYRSDLDERTCARLVLAYWCFYHLGVAARLAEAKTDKAYWGLFEAAVENKGEPKPWPRGAERRHFRGQNAWDAYAHLRRLYKTPEQAVAGMLGLPVAKAAKHFDIDIPMTFATVASAVQTHTGFGPWMAFKIADMAERVLGYEVDFSGCHLGIYKDPRQGAAVAYIEWGQDLHSTEAIVHRKDGDPWNYPISDAQLAVTVDHYVKLFRRHMAPPNGDRRVNVQEVETIFCKYKSHLKGHYPVGKDTDEIGHGLIGWGDLAEQFNQALNDTRVKILAWRKKHYGS